MFITRTVAPTTEPITVAELKTHLRIDASTEDTYLGIIIASARQIVESYILKSLITQTWNLWLDAHELKDGYIDLPRGPLQGINFFKYYTSDNTIQTFGDDYSSIITSSRLVLNNGTYFPTDLRPLNSIFISYITGYGSASSIPAEIKTAIYMVASNLYEHRGDTQDPLSPVVRLILQPYKTILF